MKTRANSCAGGGASTRRSACAGPTSARATAKRAGPHLIGPWSLPDPAGGNLDPGEMLGDRAEDLRLAENLRVDVELQRVELALVDQEVELEAVRDPGPGRHRSRDELGWARGKLDLLWGGDLRALVLGERRRIRPAGCRQVGVRIWLRSFRHLNRELRRDRIGGRRDVQERLEDVVLELRLARGGEIEAVLARERRLLLLLQRRDRLLHCRGGARHRVPLRRQDDAEPV